MPNDDWGQGLPSGPVPKADDAKSPDGATTGAVPRSVSLADPDDAETAVSMTVAPPTWTAPSFAAKEPVSPAPDGVIPPATPREVTLDQKQPSGPVTVPKSPYPPIKESFSNATASPTTAPASTAAPASSPAPASSAAPAPAPQPPHRRQPTLVYGTPALSDVTPPVGPDVQTSRAADASSFANDVDDTIINPVAPTFDPPKATPRSGPTAGAAPEATPPPAGHPATEVPRQADTEDASEEESKSPAPNVNVGAPIVEATGPGSLVPASDPRSLANEIGVPAADTIRVDPATPSTNIASQTAAGLHSAETQDAELSQLPTASAAPAADISGPSGPLPTFDDETTRDPPSATAAFFAAKGPDEDEAKAPDKPSEAPVAESPNPQAAATFASGVDDASRTKFDPPTASEAFFAAPGGPEIQPKAAATKPPSPSLAEASAPKLATPAKPEAAKPSVAPKPASKTSATKAAADKSSFAAAEPESTERLERTLGGNELSALGEDDDEFALVARSKRNTFLAAAAVLLLLIGSGVAAFALGVFDPKPDVIAKGAGRDITKDPRRELYTDKRPGDDDASGNATNATTGDDGAAANGTKATDDSPSSDTESAEAKAAQAKAAADAKAAEEAAEAEAAEAEAAEAAAAKAAEQAREEKDAKIAAAKAKAKADNENGALHAGAGDEEKPSARSRRKRRSRARGTSSAASASTETETADKKPSPKTFKFSVKAPGHIRWRTASGKELGRGNGTLKVPAGTKSIVAYDPRRGVKSKVSVKSGGAASYEKLPSGTLDLRVFPFADVYLGKDKVGTTPFTPIKVIAGTYKLKFVNGGKTRKSTVTVRPGKIKRVKVNFNAPP